MKLLVSTSRSLLLLDAATGAYHPIHQGAGLYYGIAATLRHYLVAARNRMVSSELSAENERGEILVFDLGLRYVGCWRAPFALRDIHEIKWHRRHLWVTCSYDNMVALRLPNGQWRQWYPLGEPQGQPRDINHFNSLYLAGNNVWLLAHNRGASEILHFTWPDFILRKREILGCQAHNLWRKRGGLGHLLVGQRDYSSGRIALLDKNWRVMNQITLHNEGLVLDLLPFRQGWQRWMRRCLFSL